MDGTVYVAFLHVISCDVDYTIDVVVLRDDHWGMEADPLLEPFGDLRDSNDGIPGQRVVSQVFAPAISSLLLNQRLGSSLAIAVDPNNSGTVYVAWGDQSSGYSLHLRRSSDRGQTWSNDLRTIPKATNPALAVNSAGVVGMLYQQLTGTILGPQTWDTHFETSADGFATKSDLLLARVPPEGCSDPVLGAVCQGDYDEVVTVGFDFYGVFSALNTPDATHFPNGVTYQRFADFGSKTLFADDAHTMQVKASLDPFFFKFTPGFSWP